MLRILQQKLRSYLYMKTSNRQRRIHLNTLWHVATAGSHRKLKINAYFYATTKILGKNVARCMLRLFGRENNILEWATIAFRQLTELKNIERVVSVYEMKRSLHWWPAKESTDTHWKESSKAIWMDLKRESLKISRIGVGIGGSENVRTY